MKIFKIISLLSLSTLMNFSVNAQSEDIINGEVLLKVHGIRCEVIAGFQGDISDRIGTFLGRTDNLRNLKFIDSPQVGVLLKHEIASTKGCDLKQLDEIVRQSRGRFGFLDVPVQLKRTVSAGRGNFGNCIEDVSEELSFEISNDITLISHAAISRRSNTCK